MEIRAPLALIGLFVLAAIGAVFGFVYWLNNAGGLGQRATYTVRFENTVSGLLTGAAVLFNGVRVGEVTGLRLNPEDARHVLATISVSGETPMRADTRVSLDFQGLTGVPVVTLEGGTVKLPAGTSPILVADPASGVSMTRAARDALRNVDKVVVDNSDALREAIANFGTFSATLARNSDRVDGILKGLERLTGGGTANAPPVIYDLKPVEALQGLAKSPPGAMVVPELSTVLLYDTQKLLVQSQSGENSEFENARWSDTLPKLLQARIVHSFENNSFLGIVTKPMEGLVPKYQLLIDLRRFQISMPGQSLAEIEFSATIMGDKSNVLAARIFRAAVPTKAKDPATAVESLNEAFRKAVTELIIWTVASL